MAQLDHGWGRDFATGIGSEVEHIEREVNRWVGPRIDPQVVKLAVEDARDNRRPRWQ
jgi:hypothetical protein